MPFRRLFSCWRTRRGPLIGRSCWERGSTVSLIAWRPGRARRRGGGRASASRRPRSAAIRRSRRRGAVAWKKSLDEELARLSRKYRAALVLFYLEGKTTEDVARELGCPKGTILSRLAGRDKLRDPAHSPGVHAHEEWPGLVIEARQAPLVMPPTLAAETINVAVWAAAGQAAGGAISAAVAALTKGELQAMLATKMKTVAALVLAMVLVLAGFGMGVRWALADPPAQAGNAGAKDEDRILGTWQMIAGEEEGQPAPADAVKDTKCIIAAAGKWTSKHGGMEQEFVFKLDPTKNPKAIDLTSKGHTGFGIYKFEKDTLTICVTKGEGERPTDFSTQAGTRLVLVVLRREKD